MKIQARKKGRQLLVYSSFCPFNAASITLSITVFEEVYVHYFLLLQYFNTSYIISGFITKKVISFAYCF